MWIEFAVKFGYVERAEGLELYAAYNRIIGTIVGMVNHADAWTLPGQAPRPRPC